MNINIILPPLIGGIIGYGTNYLAIKMMFHPYKEWRIGKFKVPFTPGLIPKEKDRVIKSIGLVTKESLLSEDAVERVLLSEEMQKSMEERIRQSIADMSKDATEISEIAESVVGEETFANIKEKASEKMTELIIEELKASDLGSVIIEEAKKHIGEKMSFGFLGGFLNGDFWDTMKDPVNQAIFDYLDGDGKELLRERTERKVEDLCETPLYQVGDKLTGKEDKVVSILLSLYKKIITEKLRGILESMNIPKIVEDSLGRMEIQELEMMINNIMKKELNGIVWIGALLGFIIGTLNLFFL